VALAAAAARPYLSGTAGPLETRVDISTPESPEPTAFAISPDGRRLVFVAFRNGQTQLFLRSLDADSTQPLDGTEAAILPFWSPDGRSVGFFTGQHLQRIDIDSGLVQSVARAQPGPGGTWGPGGVILFAPVPQGPLLQVQASGGVPVAVTRLGAGQSAHWSPVFLPDGRQFLFYATGSGDTRGIYLGSLDSPETTRLTDAETPGTYTSSGWVMFARQGALVARRFDPVRGTLSGNPVTVAESVALAPVYRRAAVSISATGTIAYRTGAAMASQLTWFDRTGRAVGTLGEPGPSGPWNVALSRDGHRAAVERAGRSNSDIWIVDSRGATPFTADTPGTQRFPLWSPDSTRIAYASNSPPVVDGIYQRASNDAGGEELLVAPRKILSDWSRDGRFLLSFEVDQNKTGPDIWVLPTFGDKKPWAFLRTDARELWGQFSPDGRWLAYQSDESGRFEIYVRPFPGPGGKWTVSTAGGIHPRWSADGKELFYLAPDGRLTLAAIAVRNSTLEASIPVALFPTRIVGGGGNLAGFRQQYEVAPDGRFLLNVALASDPQPITLLLNWKPRE
jgi:Tol biopolymer transport system component